ncbi:MAG: malto-oligosyltrehalose trehalohydrolase [Desulfuromonadaceae bacterium]|nr:malto-oligosyltrehalose trehalohydrolase [Desulfuromonadaceae bacterium]MDD5105384.1 malto-oligosyltrehalose trehalohydrolase [Desulfuromonadaceae bacterium]
MKNDLQDIGAIPLPDGSTRFRVWAPRVREVAVIILDNSLPPVPLSAEADGYFSGIVTGAGAGSRYRYLLDGSAERPDPASHYQPNGVHGPSQIVDNHAFHWSDNAWSGIPLEQYIIYELHVGTFTPNGTFDSVISRLDYLCDLGITAVELMPVAQFPGERNWGYDGVYPFAPQNSYGGPDALKRLIDTCHRKGLAVILDVVYNHLGPEGNYLHAFGPYFTDRYRTPWGEAVNFDGPDSDPVRHYFITNALYWITDYHVDALRLDAIHGIYDFGARHILQEMTETVHRQAAALGQTVHVIAESDLNDVRVITPLQSGGLGLDAQWCDDFHHSLRSLLTGETDGYYRDFGHLENLAKALQQGFVLSGEYSVFRMRKHGSSAEDVPPCRLVVFSQNHDQVGNRMCGERLGEHLTSQQLKLAAATVLLSPYLPLLFMGEEYAALAPFPYFVSHGDANLVEGVRRGRKEEFAAFKKQGIPPDPQAEATFLSAKLNPGQLATGEQRDILDFYRTLIRLRKECALLAELSRDAIQIMVNEEEMVLTMIRTSNSDEITCLFNFSDQVRVIRPSQASGTMRILLDSSGRYQPNSCATTFSTRPATFLTLAPFGVLICRKE